MKQHLINGADLMTQGRNVIKAVVAAPILYALTASAATAQQATYLDNEASYCEIFQAINPEVPERCLDELQNSRTRGLSRGITIHKAQQAVNSAMQGAKGGDAAVPAGPREIAMNIQFEFDSSRLTPEAMATLDRVADVLNSELMRDTAIVVEGHTDAIGSEDYNLSLSTQRALSVQFYLVEQHSISMDRLQVTGKGEVELYDPANPTGALNRRVEFTNLNS